MISSHLMLMPLFQSTPLIRGATRHQRADARRRQISIHAPHTRSDNVWASRHLQIHISIHAPHTRSDLHPCAATSRTHDFNPRPSYEERPYIWLSMRAHSYFNPRPSYEERPAELWGISPTTVFQSTPLIRGATAKPDSAPASKKISIHAPHTRSDSQPHHGCRTHQISIHAPHTRSDSHTFTPSFF